MTDMVERKPLVSADQLDGLDDAEMIEGYNDGREGWKEPGDNRSLSYWHGWRNGMVDGGHAKGDIYQELLVRSCIASQRVAALGTVEKDGE